MTGKLLLSAVLFVTGSASASAAVGAAAYKGADPIGGGAGYTKYVDAAKATYVVSNFAELKDALGKAKAGEVVYVRDGAEIDATGQTNVKIPGGVTLAGNRGKNGAAGSLIKTEKRDLGVRSWVLFIADGPGILVTGLRIQGPDTEMGKGSYDGPTCNGITCSYPNLEVDNCEISGFSHAGIFLSVAGQGARIHNNDIHHCRRNGLGYGICLHQSQALIECNHFADNRHDIAGTGRAGTSYLARYNISDTTDTQPQHAFDMHGNHESRPEGEDWPKFAGDSIVICYNTFRARTPRDGVTIRANPRLGATIHHNLFVNARFGVKTWEYCYSANVYDNAFVNKPQYAYYRFDSEGNRLNGKKMPAGYMKDLGTFVPKEQK